VVTITPLPTKTYSPEEYLALEVESETRSEYRNGEIVEMTGGTPTHNKIVSALNAILWFGLRGKSYSIFVADQRVAFPESNLYSYPDVVVVADPLQLLEGRKDTITNPLFIAEVLSDSTRSYDRGDKFGAYRSIDTFQEYLLIDQHQIHAEQFTKQSINQWLFTEHSGKDARITLSSVGMEFSLADLYENVEF
jgi:Uma2 family endonuclease